MSAEANRIDWRIAGGVALWAVAAFGILLSADDFTFLVAYFLAGLTTTLLLFAFLVANAISKSGRGLSLLAALIVFWVVASILFVNYDATRTHARWLLWSRHFKQYVLAQPEPANGELRHIEWDAWGYAGADTEIYLVFDPTDSLASESRKRTSGKFSGIPCEVFRLHHLENHWFTARFYTDEEWDHCS